ncbi:hypothetical protein [Allorhodopirellula solitaria]|uniref:Quinol:cytochrome C oxidoreductase n=1 Tax=Allorhodopirellula solitaria TaxID=2527987 RepID=A0A5C5XWT6_9BACT|nr:hypothetical protein [Allorhodopirellula solitaria]TWT67148.1 hypothetical protein CA85_19950 [Allorhodopirellula solitaria]
MSHHHAVAPKPADDPAFTMPAMLSGLSLPLCVVGLIALVGGTFLGSSAVGGRFGMSAYLTAYMYAMTIAIGAMFFVLIQHLVRAGWSVVVRRVAELIMIMVVPLAVLFIPIGWAVWTGSLYVWTDAAGYQAEHHIPADAWAEKIRWLNPQWFTLRACVYLGVYCLIGCWYYSKSQRQDQTGEVTLTESMQARGGPAIILFALCTSLLAADWVMSLAPMWFSTMFGVYIFAGSILSAHCAIALLSFVLQKQGAMRDEVTIEHYHDLGKLIHGFVCFWAYIAFSQYMLIWYANIPEETVWFFTRYPGFSEDFGPISIALMVLHFGVPFLGIMSRHVRRTPWAVAAWATYILVLHFVDLYWAIMPEATVGSGGAMGVLASVLTVLGMVCLMLGLIVIVGARTRLIPVRDPRLAESLAFENI